MKKGLEGLEGVKSAESLNYDNGRGDFRVVVDERKSVTHEALRKAVKYTLDAVEIAIVGDASKDDKGVWLTARGSGAKFPLVNRAKKDDEKEAPKVVEQIEGFLKDGSKLVKVSGALAVDKDVQIIRLESAAIVKPEKK